ncbi:MAG: hypothetical protein QOC72_3694 [Methylobacteriaceae bacterium]|jgi:hypothetical protein|nr:hypothetical protein [Methylobacteriaceae bacterium]
MSRSTLFSAVLCALLVQQASAGVIQTPQCTKDMSSVDSSFQETLGNLQKSGRSAAVPSARCAAYKHHIEVMKNASAIFARCTTEPDRTQNISQMNGTIADINDTLKNEKCQ